MKEKQKPVTAAELPVLSPELMKLMQNQKRIGYVQCFLGDLVFTFVDNTFLSLPGRLKDVKPWLNRKKFIAISKSCIIGNDFLWWHYAIGNGQMAVMNNKEELRVAEGARTKAFRKRVKSIKGVYSYPPKEWNTDNASAN